MTLRHELKAAVLQLATSSTQNAVQTTYEFEQLALEIFQFQAAQNPIYKRYVELLRIRPSEVKRLEGIPCLPIQFFKYHTIQTGELPSPAITFESSGTTGDTPSRHHVWDLPYYELLSQLIFEQTYGPLSDYHLLALLPSYLERNTSSLVYMVQNFIHRSYSMQSGFYLHNTEELLKQLNYLLSTDSRKILLIGVTFGLLDLAESGSDLSFLKPYADRLVIMETGGMKGRRREMIRAEVHEVLKQAFGVEAIHSEYGMTELLSQAYATQGGHFTLPPTLRVLLRELNDPFAYLPGFAVGSRQVSERGKTGGINVIDLANIDSCCFIETQDLGRFADDYQAFEVMGRFDNSEIRGCNLMISG